jgi:mannose PTS system EIID component
LTFSLRMSACSIIAHWADRFAERGDIGWVARSNFVFSQPFLVVLYAVPVALAARLGSDVVGEALGWIGANAGWVMGGLFTASGMLAALGIALNLKFLLQKRVWPYFFIGFLIVTMMEGDVNLLLLFIVGTCVAFLHVLFSEGLPKDRALTGDEEDGEQQGPGLLTRRDVFKSWLLWLFFSHAAWNWERMQGLGFAHSMTPIIKKLYTTKEEISAALKRHLVFFNTQPDAGSIVNGVVISMEEKRAGGAPIDGDAINAVKTGLMGPIAGIGDTLQQGILIPIALSIGISIALGSDLAGVQHGNILGPIVYAILVAIGIWGGGWFLWWQGYQQGRAAVTSILRSGTLQRTITGAGVLGNLIMGALVVEFVSLSIPIGFQIGGTVFEIQAILDTLMPNLLPLLLVLLIWWLIARKNLSPTWIMAAIIAVAIVASIPVFPSINAETGEVIRRSVGLLSS